MRLAPKCALFELCKSDLYVTRPSTPGAHSIRQRDRGPAGSACTNVWPCGCVSVACVCVCECAWLCVNICAQTVHLSICLWLHAVAHTHVDKLAHTHTHTNTDTRTHSRAGDTHAFCFIYLPFCLISNLAHNFVFCCILCRARLTRYNQRYACVCA